MCFLCLWTLYWNLAKLYSSTLDYVRQPQLGFSSVEGVTLRGRLFTRLVFGNPCCWLSWDHLSLTVVCVCFRFPWVQVCLKCVSIPLILTYVRSWLIFKPLSHVWLTASTAPVTTSNCRKISASLHRKVNKTRCQCFPHCKSMNIHRITNVFFVFCWNERILWVSSVSELFKLAMILLDLWALFTVNMLCIVKFVGLKLV